MRRSRFSEEKIIAILKEHEAGTPTREILRRHAISRQTFYNWKKKYAGLEVNQARRLRQLEEENRRLKKIVADLSLDKEALEAALGKKW